MKREDVLRIMTQRPVREMYPDVGLYEVGKPATHLHLVVSGGVETFYFGDGHRSVSSIVWADGFCGLEVFLPEPQPCYGETARTMMYGLKGYNEPKTQVMSWTAAEAVHLARKHPELGIGFLQMVLEREKSSQDKQRDWIFESVLTCVAKELLRITSSCPYVSVGDDGLTNLPPFTHDILARLVGTSREMVTHSLNKLKRSSVVSYKAGMLRVPKSALESYLRGRGPNQSSSAAA